MATIIIYYIENPCAIVNALVAFVFVCVLSVRVLVCVCICVRA